MEERGYIYGPEKDEALKTSPALVPYAELDEELKKQNRLNVRDIPVKLSQAGYIMIPARGDEKPFSFPDETVEMLAEAEHERWMQSMLDDGWSYAPDADPEKKQNVCLLPWSELPEEEKEKDRDLVRGIPNVLAQAGYTIV
jgi:rubredoxin